MLKNLKSLFKSNVNYLSIPYSDLKAQYDFIDEIILKMKEDSPSNILLEENEEYQKLVTLKAELYAQLKNRLYSKFGI